MTISRSIASAAAGALIAVVPLTAAHAAPAPEAGHAVEAKALSYIGGLGDPTDDWTNEPTIGLGNSSNYVGMWQTVLWADGKLKKGKIDCNFGNDTKAATKQWQESYGVEADGVVGPKTLAKAGKWLRGGGENVWFDGSVGDIGFARKGSHGRYVMNMFGENRTVWKSDVTFSRCK